MSDSEGSHFQLLMVGLPKSGKTTFLAALWHVLTQREANTQLTLTKSCGDRGYLNRICESWRGCKPIGRTPLQTEEEIVLHLASRFHGDLDLSIPDLSGEAFELQISERRWSKGFDDKVKIVDGVLLFLHPDDLRQGTQISTLNELEKALSPRENSLSIAANQVEANRNDVVPWSFEYIPTQVKLVELLQFLIGNRERCLRVMIVISAWDLLLPLGKTPQQILKEQLPLLGQFLETNSHAFECNVTGISAQGGPLPEKETELLKLGSPVDRLKVVGVKITENDITSPIAWLLENSEAIIEKN